MFRVSERSGAYRRWEPVYISNNKEPFYDEKLTWEGKQDKMSQVTSTSNYFTYISRLTLRYILRVLKLITSVMCRPCTSTSYALSRHALTAHTLIKQ